MPVFFFFGLSSMNASHKNRMWWNVSMECFSAQSVFLAFIVLDESCGAVGRPFCGVGEREEGQAQQRQASERG